MSTGSSLRRVSSELGHTLLEAVFTIALAVAVIALLGGTLLSAVTTMTEIMESATLEDTEQRVLDRLVWEVRFAQTGSIVLDQPMDAHSITFNKLTGWQASTLTYSTPQTISFASGEVTLNGITISAGIKNLTFNQNGNVVTAAIEVEKSFVLGGISRTISKRSTVQVCPRAEGGTT